MSTVIQTQIAAIQARIDALAPEASSEDVVMLAKAVEAVAGQATVFDLIETASAEREQISVAGAAQQDQLTTAGIDALDAINAARDQVTAHVQAQGITRADLHATLLSF